MPKIVDHSLQRQRIANAAFRLIQKEGIEHTTVRAIAQEAGMSVGSMRHYLATQDDLFIFAMQLCAEQNRTRVEALPQTGSALEQLSAFLEQLLPLDEERLLETKIWLAFVARAQANPTLVATLKEINEGLLLYIQVVIDVLTSAGYLSQEPTDTLEADHLLALVNGLAINALLFPDRMAPDKVRAVLKHHLLSLLPPNVL